MSKSKVRQDEPIVVAFMAVRRFWKMLESNTETSDGVVGVLSMATVVPQFLREQATAMDRRMENVRRISRVIEASLTAASVEQQRMWPDTNVEFERIMREDLNEDPDAGS